MWLRLEVMAFFLFVNLTSKHGVSRLNDAKKLTFYDIDKILIWNTFKISITVLQIASVFTPIVYKPNTLQHKTICSIITILDTVTPTAMSHCLHWALQFAPKHVVKCTLTELYRSLSRLAIAWKRFVLVGRRVVWAHAI